MGRCEHLIGMAVDLHIAPDLDDAAVGPDQNRRTKYALEGSAIHGFFTPNAVRLQHLMRLIRGKRNREFVLVAKGFLGFWRVGRNAQYRGMAFRKFALQAREVDGFLGATRGVRTWIKKQHEFSPGEVGQRNRLASIARQAEGGRFGALGQGGFTACGGSGFWSLRRGPASGPGLGSYLGSYLGGGNLAGRRRWRGGRCTRRIRGLLGFAWAICRRP